MTARIPIVAIGALIMAGSLINCLSQDKYHTTRCLRVCGLNERKTLTKSAQVSYRFLLYSNKNVYIVMQGDQPLAENVEF